MIISIIISILRKKLNKSLSNLKKILFNLQSHNERMLYIQQNIFFIFDVIYLFESHNFSYR